MINFLESIFLIISTVVGLGIFVLPYSLAHSGAYFWIWFLVLTTAIFLLHLVYSEIIFQIEEKHNLPGLAEKLVNKNAKFPVWIFDFAGIQLVFLVYLIALGNFLEIIFPFDPIYIKLFFALLVIVIILFSINPFAKIETSLSFILLFLFLFLIFYFLPNVKLDNFKFEFLNPWLSYGILLFSLTGYSSLQMVYDLIGKEKRKFLYINIISILAIAILYALFTFSIYGAIGKNISQETLSSLPNLVNFNILVLTIALAVLNIITTFIALAFYLKRGLVTDFNINEKISWILVSLPILIFSLLPLENLAKIVSIIGSLFIGINLMVIFACYLRLKEIQYFYIPKIIVRILIILFGIGWLFGILYG